LISVAETTQSRFKRLKSIRAARKKLTMKIEHIALWCKNIDVLKDFYVNYFDARANDRYVNHSKNFSSYFLSFESGARLEIMQMASVSELTPSPYDQCTGYVHMAVSVGSEEKVDALTRRLQNDGYEILDGPRRTGDGYYESVVLDPEMNKVEITV
jgi:lactoylglutathione lyase